MFMVKGRLGVMIGDEGDIVVKWLEFIFDRCN